MTKVSSRFLAVLMLAIVIFMSVMTSSAFAAPRGRAVEESCHRFKLPKLPKLPEWLQRPKLLPEWHRDSGNFLPKPIQENKSQKVPEGPRIRRYGPVRH